MPAFLATPNLWMFISLLLNAATSIFPHASALAPTAAAMGQAASAGDVQGSATIGLASGVSALVGLALHAINHGATQASSNAPAQTQQPPNAAN